MMDYEDKIDRDAKCRSGCKHPIFTITSCMAQIDERFFLLMEIGIKGTKIEKFTIMEITEVQAGALMAVGVMRCKIVTTIPTGRKVEIICAFVVNGNTFIVFSVKNAKDCFVLVRVPLCTII